jgi:hypothetical protein
LVTIFSSFAGNSASTGTCDGTFSSPTGSPTLNPESGLSVSDCASPLHLAADVWTREGGSFGGYSTTPTPNNSGGTAPLPAWQVLIPPL